MIKNDRSYRITKAAAERFAQALADHEARPIEDADPIARTAELSSLRAQLEDLHTQISEYEGLRAGGITALEATRLDDLPALLIRARIAQQLTHEQLAEMIDVKPQQIQRWEEDDYHSAAFWRLVDIADALGVSVSIQGRLPEASVPDVDIVVDKLKLAGVDNSFIKQKLLPEPSQTAGKRQAACLVAARLEAILGRSVPELIAANDTVGWTQNAMANARFKLPARAKAGHVGLFSAYAYFLVSALCETHGEFPSDPLPDDWAGMRDWLFCGGRPDLRTGVARLWQAKIPVLPLISKGGPHGACWRIGGRGAVVLNQPAKTASRWLFDLVHELCHLKEAGDREEFELLEGEGTFDNRRLSPEEARAHAFAADVLLAGRSDALYRAVIHDADSQANRMKSALVRIAKAQGVEVGLLAQYTAFRFFQEEGGNIWGVAQMLQDQAEMEPFAIVRDVLIEQVDMPTVPELARGLLRQALTP